MSMSKHASIHGFFKSTHLSQIHSTQLPICKKKKGKKKSNNQTAAPPPQITTSKYKLNGGIYI